MCLMVVFFCIKQKTAYEVRISDWSSDVCSSDLFGAEVADELSLVVEAGGHDRHRRTSCWFRRTIGLGAGAARPVRASCDRPGSPSVRRSRRRGGARCCWSRASANRRALRPPRAPLRRRAGSAQRRSEEHTSELQSLMRSSYAVFCLKKKKKNTT